ncbi:MAG: methyl-accepting chemotaxis protein [Clostridiales bacterium]|jgi:hypothetical protein|nr:methyl-accepting chemotaxis protein [Clostridiales bacterium]
MEIIGEQREALIAKGFSDFKNAVINFTIVQNELLGFAIIRNLEQVKENSDYLTREVTRLAAMAKQIDKISSRTQMLSINASVEAARAGQAGKSFSVVAQEISELSKNTKECSGETDKCGGEVGRRVGMNSDRIGSLETSVMGYISALGNNHAVLMPRIQIEENGFLLTTLPKRLEDHANFIRAYIKNFDDPSVKVVDHKSCKLGKWYEASRSKYGGMPLFERLYGVHQNFHKLAIDFKATGQHTLILEFSAASHEILHIFTEMMEDFKRRADGDESYFNIG